MWPFFSHQLITTVWHQNQEQQSCRAQGIRQDIPTSLHVMFYGQSCTHRLYARNSKYVKFKILHRIFCSESSSTFIESITYITWPFMLLDNMGIKEESYSNSHCSAGCVGSWHSHHVLILVQMYLSHGGL